MLVGFDADTPISATTALQICNGGIPEPEPEPKIWVPDSAAGIAEHTRKLRESERMEAIETARLVELARLKARDEYEAGKRAAPSASATSATPDGAAETQEARQARRYRACIDAGLKMPADDFARLPRGINKIANGERITRQALAEDLKAHIRRLHCR